MKKLFMAIVCLMTMVIFTSCDSQEKIEEEVNAAIEQYGKFMEQCANKHIEDNIELLKNKKKSDTKQLIQELKEEISAINSKCFDKLFDKYDENKVLFAVNKWFNSIRYEDIDIKSKEQFYDGLVLIGIRYYSNSFENRAKEEILKLEMELTDKKIKALEKRLYR